MTDGFVISAAVLFAVPIAFTLIPTRMRTAQAAFDEAGFEATHDDAPGLASSPRPAGIPGPVVATEAAGSAAPSAVGRGREPVRVRVRIDRM